MVVHTISQLLPLNLVPKIYPLHQFAVGEADLRLGMF